MIPFHTALTATMSPRNGAVSIAPTSSMTGSTQVWNQSTTTWTAAMIPSHTAVTVSLTAVNPLLTPSQTADRIGTRVVWNQSTTAATASWMACQAAATIARPVSVWVANHTTPATTAAIAVMIRPRGLRFITTLKAAWAAFATLVALVKADRPFTHWISPPAAMTALCAL